MGMDCGSWILGIFPGFAISYTYDFWCHSLKLALCMVVHFKGATVVCGFIIVGCGSLLYLHIRVFTYLFKPSYDTVAYEVSFS